MELTHALEDNQNPVPISIPITDENLQKVWSTSPKFQDLLSQFHNPSSPPRSTSSNESSSCSLAHCLQILQHACMCIRNSQPEAQSCYVSCADFQHPRSNACSNGLNPHKAQLPQRSWRLLSEGPSCCRTAALHEDIVLQG
jgi:hypothetical protein